MEDLDSARYPQRKRATEQLEKLGELAESALRKSLGNRPALEMRQRVELLLARIEKARENPTSQSLQGLRALEVLELLDTEKARGLLKAIAGGAPDAQLTQEATASLQRLAKRRM